VPERERFWQVPFVKMIGSPPHLVIQAALCQKFGSPPHGSPLNLVQAELC
jgi:hypothetical protein